MKNYIRINVFNVFSLYSRLEEEDEPILICNQFSKIEEVALMCGCNRKHIDEFKRKYEQEIKYVILVDDKIKFYLKNNKQIYYFYVFRHQKAYVNPLKGRLIELKLKQEFFRMEKDTLLRHIMGT